MKNFLILVLICSSQYIFSQTENYSSNNSPRTVINEDNSIHTLTGVEVKPVFPGGTEELYRFIKENYKIPETARLKGKVYITFIIEKDGSLSDIKAIRDLRHGTDEEAIRVLKIVPHWIPGKQNGKAVRVHYSMAIPINE